jgi:aryl-alcohol dehydrogenase-like predicted oxidoreductase
MIYNRLGNTGLVISKLTFGAGSLGVGQTLPGLVKNIDQPLADRVVAHALDVGINSFDTSNKYVEGRSEITLGKALGARRKDVVIASKCGLPVGPSVLDRGLSMRHIISACEDSLNRLGTDWIDVYHTHTQDFETTPLEETARAFEHLITSGKVRYVAVSNWPAWMTALFQGLQGKMGYSPICATQVYYSLVGRGIEKDLVPLSKATGLGITIYSPLAGGFLSGKYYKDQPAPEGSRRATFNVAPKIDMEPGWKLVDMLREMAEAHDATPAHIAMAWIMSKPFINSIIFGISRIEQLQDNVKAVDVKLSAEDIQRLDDASAHAIV